MPTEEPQPRPSSTVVLVRPGDGAPEVFMVKRHRMASFGSSFAFPGGVLEATDACVHGMSSGMSAEQANRLLDVKDGALDYYSAAIRELFEESGVLLADHDLTTAELDSARASLNAGTLGWDAFAADKGVALLYDQLLYFSFWITPPGLPKRYSARFFLAQSPRAQQATHDGAELTESCWMSAADILKARKNKTMKLPYVTRKTLKRVACFASIAELLVWAQACGDKGVICDQPAFPPDEVA
jgi:8-oxo-dGTP pyrophosphatase MutT (NUDIX family)